MDSEDRTWWRGVDGLRAVAVIAVLVYHQVPSGLPGGFLGVSLFFTLSGFLITNVVLDDHQSIGTVGLTRFWARRIRRLLPVALLGLVAALVVTVITVDVSRIGTTMADIRFAALDVANWRFVFRNTSYADAMSAPSPVLHYWSLAIEEQFYVVFPIVALFALRRGRKFFAFVLGAVVVLATARQLTISGFDRIYYGTDTRAGELAIGALTAIGWRSWGHRLRAGALDAAGSIAAVALAVAWCTVTYGSKGLEQGGLVGHAVVSAVVIVAAIGGRWFPLVLGWRPLVALGRISYGVYVFHFPLFLLLTQERTGASGLALFALRFATTLAIAAIAHVLVEAPVRWRGALPSRRGAVAAVAGLACVLMFASGLAIATRPARSTPPDHVALSTMPVSASSPVATSATPSPVDPAVVSARVQSPSEADTPAPGPPPETPVPRLLVVGDSTAVLIGKGMQQWATATGAAEVDVAADFACVLFNGDRARLRSGWEFAPGQACAHLIDDAVAAANSFKPDAIVLFIGSMQLADWRSQGEEQWRAIGDPVYDARYVTGAEGALTRLEAAGVPVLVADVATPNWEPAFAGSVPGSGPATINNAERADRLNLLTSAIVATHTAMTVIPFAAGAKRPDGSVDPALRPDGLHLTEDAVVEVMNGWLLDDLIAGYRRVAAATPSTVRRPTIWASS